MFDKLKADMAKALFSLPAVVGVEYGAGFKVAAMRGSEHNDLFAAEKGPTGPRVHTLTNRHGGMLGGISSGMPIVIRAAIKPTSSLPLEQATVTQEGETDQHSHQGPPRPLSAPALRANR